MTENPTIPLLAGGSNTLIADKTFSRVLVLDTPFFQPQREEDRLLVSAPQKISTLFPLLIKHQLGGLEFMAGVPRVTLGGAIYQNFGAFDKCIADHILSVKTMINQHVVELDNAACQFSYRNSIFQKNHYPILSATLQLTHSTDTQSSLHNMIARRQQHQPLKLPNIGSTFKNPPTLSAGKLIDLAGLKGHRIGDAQIWEGHGNFIINTGNARFAEVMDLIEHTRKVVKSQTGTLLEPEICILQ